MSPTGNSLQSHGGEGRDNIGACTYNHPATQVAQSSHHSFEAESNTALAASDTTTRYNEIIQSTNNFLRLQPLHTTNVQSGHRNKRISSRTPRKHKISDHFPVAHRAPNPVTEQGFHPVAAHRIRELPSTGQRLITPSSQETGRRTNQRRGTNYMGSKTNRSILMEFQKEGTPSKKRQSRLYSYGDWTKPGAPSELSEEFFGHSLEQIDNTKVFRVLLQNPNGINPDPTNDDLHFSLRTCYDQCVASISLTETNVEWQHYYLREQLKESVKKHWDGVVVQTSTSTEKFTSRYKPGGTATILCGSHWVARIIERGEDKSGLGRWSYVGLQGNRTTKILDVTYYRVCQLMRELAGEKTAFHQQYTLLRERFPLLDIDPRRQSVLDFQLFLSRKLAEGYYVILHMDGNENLSSGKGGWCPVSAADDAHHAFQKNHDGSILTLLKLVG